MSHRAGHIIVKALLTVPTLTPEQRTHLLEIEGRDQYSISDRLFLCVLTYQVADDLIEDH